MFPLHSCNMNPMTSTEWKRVAQAVVSRRTQMGMKTAKALAEAADLTTRVIGDIENARRTNYGQGTKAQIENALKWAPGSIDMIVAGHAPIVLGGTVTHERREEYPPRILMAKDDSPEIDLIARSIQTALDMLHRGELGIASQLINKASADLTAYIESGATNADTTTDTHRQAQATRTSRPEDQKSNVVGLNRGKSSPEALPESIEDAIAARPQDPRFPIGYPDTSDVGEENQDDGSWE